VSMHVAHGTSIDYVAVYNRVDSVNGAALLGEFEIWVGSSVGDTASTSAVKCAGPIEAPWSGHNVVSPTVVSCQGAVGDYVTLRQVGPSRYLTIVELEAYTADEASLVAAASATPSNSKKGDQAASHPEAIPKDSIYYTEEPVDAQLPVAPCASSATTTPSDQGLFFVLAGALALAFVCLVALMCYARWLRRQLRSLEIPANVVVGTTCGLGPSMTRVANETSGMSKEESLGEKSHGATDLPIDQSSHGSLPADARV